MEPGRRWEPGIVCGQHGWKGEGGIKKDLREKRYWTADRR
jgi:hypothetical protein